MIINNIEYPETDRICIVPLTYEELWAYLKTDFSLETMLGVVHYPRHTPDFFREIIESSVLPVIKNSGNEYRCYNTIWVIIDKEKHVMVGDICFKGLPNAKGEIEIGYGIYPDFEKQGYMSEGVRLLVKWASTQPGVDTVVAETDNDNVASHRVLEKNKFRIFKSVHSMLWWRIDVRKPHIML